MDGALDDFIAKSRPGKGGARGGGGPKKESSNGGGMRSAGGGGRPRKDRVDGAIDMALDDVITSRPKGKGKGKREKGSSKGAGKGGSRLPPSWGGRGGKGGGFDDDDLGGYSYSGVKGRGRRYDPYDAEMGGGGGGKGGRGDTNGYGKWNNDLFDDRDRDGGRAPQQNGGGGKGGFGGGAKGGGFRAKGGGDRWGGDDGDGGNKVLVENLEYSIMAEDLEELFGSIGSVQKAWINYDSTDRSEGSGGCMFVGASEARRAVQRYHGSTIEGLKIAVSLDHSRGKGGSKGGGKGKSPW